MNVSDIIMPPEHDMAHTPSDAGPADTGPAENGQNRHHDQNPADRLELALNRIAFALDRRAELASVARPSAPDTDLQALAANIDALIARVRDVLGDEGRLIGGKD